MALKVKEAPNGFLATLAYKEQRVNEKKGPKSKRGIKNPFSSHKTKSRNSAKDLPKVLDNRPLKTIERQIAQLTKKKLIARKGSKKQEDIIC